MTLKRVAIPTTTYSSRGGTTVSTIVLHTAEGAANFRDLGAFFQNSADTSNPTSSHVGIDDTPATVGEYVPRSGSAWTQGNANKWCVSAELCAFAAWTPGDWANHDQMLANTAQWIAEEAAAFGIPIVRLTPAQAQDPTTRGVCQHIDLGQLGGGHVDCDYGTGNFPMDQVLAMASGSSGPAPSPPTTDWSTENMILVDPRSGGTWFVASKEGAVYTGGGAPYIGATNNNAMNEAHYPCVGIDSRPNDDGFRIVLDWGAGKGDQSADGTGPRFRTYDFPYDGSGKATGGTY